MIIKQALLSSLAAVGFAACVAAAPQPASTGMGALPDGSWRQSCDKAYVQTGTLHETGQARRHIVLREMNFMGSSHGNVTGRV